MSSRPAIPQRVQDSTGRVKHPARQVSMMNAMTVFKGNPLPDPEQIADPLKETHGPVCIVGEIMLPILGNQLLPIGPTINT